MITCLNIANYKLGNSLFQLCATIGHALDNNDVPVIPNNYKYIPMLNIPENWIGMPMVGNIYNDPQFSYTEIPYRKNTSLDSYFQSEKYFIKHEKVIREILSLKKEEQERLENVYSFIFEGPCASFHIRRGDYLKFPDIHPTQSVEYYESAANLLKEKCGDLNCIIFSDDIEWCKQNLKFLKNILGKEIFFIQSNPDYVDLFLMSFCTHNVIANSSFSWFGAWLNKNVNKTVIAPKKWFGINGPQDTDDLIPEKWIQI